MSLCLRAKGAGGVLSGSVFDFSTQKCAASNYGDGIFFMG